MLGRVAPRRKWGNTFSSVLGGHQERNKRAGESTVEDSGRYPRTGTALFPWVAQDRCATRCALGYLGSRKAVLACAPSLLSSYFDYQFRTGVTVLGLYGSPSFRCGCRLLLTLRLLNFSVRGKVIP